MCYVNISLVTDYDVGLEGDLELRPVSTDEVLQVLAKHNERVRTAIGEIVRRSRPTTTASATRRSRGRASNELMMRRRRGGVDLGAYWRAIPLYVRNPWLALGPLLTSLIGALLLILVPPSGPTGGGVGGSLMTIFVMLLDSFGLSISLIVAERAWRLGKGPFDDALVDARRKAPDILLAAIGLQLPDLRGGARRRLPRKHRIARADRGRGVLLHLHDPGGRDRRRARRRRAAGLARTRARFAAQHARARGRVDRADPAVLQTSST